MAPPFVLSGPAVAVRRWSASWWTSSRCLNSEKRDMVLSTAFIVSDKILRVRAIIRQEREVKTLLMFHQKIIFLTKTLPGGYEISFLYCQVTNTKLTFMTVCFCFFSDTKRLLPLSGKKGIRGAITFESGVLHIALIIIVIETHFHYNCRNWRKTRALRINKPALFVPPAQNKPQLLFIYELMFTTPDWDWRALSSRDEHRAENPLQIHHPTQVFVSLLQ